MNKFLAWFITFNFINISLVFFRAKGWDDAIKVLTGMVKFNQDVNLQVNYSILVFVLLSTVIVFFIKNTNQLLHQEHLFKDSTTMIHLRIIYFAILFLISILYMSISEYTEFIYFNF